MITAIELSKYVVSKCMQYNTPISNLQLQKILYYIQYEVLKKTDDIAFPDSIEAWQFGPVIPNIYYYFCGFGARKINTAFLENEYDSVVNSEIKEIFDRVIKEKSKLYPWDMVIETHKKNGAWDLTYNSGKGFKEIISIECIKKEIENERRILNEKKYI